MTSGEFKSGSLLWNLTRSIKNPDVVLLVHLDGTGTPTSIITDSSPYNNSTGWTVSGDPILSYIASQTGFGNRLQHGSGSGGLAYINSPDLALYSIPANIDFTIEFKPFTVTNLAIQRWLGSKTWYFGTTNNPTRIFARGPFGELRSNNQITGASHIALVRKDGIISFFINGIKQTTTATFEGAMDSGTQTITLLNSGGADNRSYNGGLDEVRITKGYAWYTSDFVIPTQSF